MTAPPMRIPTGRTPCIVCGHRAQYMVVGHYVQHDDRRCPLVRAPARLSLAERAAIADETRQDRARDAAGTEPWGGDE